MAAVPARVPVGRLFSFSETSVDIAAFRFAGHCQQCPCHSLRRESLRFCHQGLKISRRFMEAVGCRPEEVTQGHTVDVVCQLPVVVLQGTVMALVKLQAVASLGVLTTVARRIF